MQKDANPGSPSYINYSSISVGNLSFHPKKLQSYMPPKQLNAMMRSDQNLSNTHAQR